MVTPLGFRSTSAATSDISHLYKWLLVQPGSLSSGPNTHNAIYYWLYSPSQEDISQLIWNGGPSNHSATYPCNIAKANMSYSKSRYCWMKNAAVHKMGNNFYRWAAGMKIHMHCYNIIPIYYLVLYIYIYNTIYFEWLYVYALRCLRYVDLAMKNEREVHEKWKNNNGKMDSEHFLSRPSYPVIHNCFFCAVPKKKFYYLFRWWQKR